MAVLAAMKKLDERFLLPGPVLAVGAFLLVHLVLRMCMSSSLFQDDADLLLFGQSMQWGYSQQPPLYSWLLQPWLELFGGSLFVLTAFRTLVLASVPLML